MEGLIFAPHATPGWRSAQWREAVCCVGSLDDPGCARGPVPAPTARDEAERARSGAPARFHHRRAMARALAAAEFGAPREDVEIGYGPQGAPMFVRLGAMTALPRLSLAARNDVLAVAFARGPVGVDIEPIVEGALPLNLLRAQERAVLERAAEAERGAAFLKLWTAKEAYLKAAGTGLLRAPEEVEARETPGGFEFFERGVFSGTAVTATVLVAGRAHALALALRD